MKRTALAIASVGAAAALTLTACSSSGGGSQAAAAKPPATSGGTSVTISMTSGHLVGPGNRTLYSNSADSTTHLICTGSCLTIWPAVTGTPVAGAGVQANSLGTVSRGSTTQITYQGHPLYEFSSDTKAGDAKGDGISDAGGTWHPAGAAAASGGASSASTGGGGSGGGYGYP